MLDTRPKAMEKAHKRMSSEVQSGEALGSERKRANQALRNEMSFFRGDGVYKIPEENEATIPW